jgi:hypothetical protein
MGAGVPGVGDQGFDGAVLDLEVEPGGIIADFRVLASLGR